MRRVAGATLAAATLLASSARVSAQTASQDSGSAVSYDGSDEGLASGARGAFADSLRLLFIEHTTRVLFQEKTREGLQGPFFHDYVRSLHMPRTWADGDNWAVNDIGHPIHGAAAGFIWINHERGRHDLELGFSKAYWASRARATAWAAVYSLQFEVGPLSEASIGNVGMDPRTTGWTDYVMTPVGALGIMVAEDLIQLHVLNHIESWTDNRLIRAVSRTLLNPGRTMSYAAQGQMPWARPTASRR